MSTDSGLRRDVRFGIASLVAAIPAAWAIFAITAEFFCFESDDCYGESGPVPPIAVAGVVLIGLVLTGIIMIEKGTPHDRRAALVRRIGRGLMWAAFPVGILANGVISSRYCPSGCSGDWMVLGLLALLAGAAMMVMLLAIGAWEVRRARRWEGLEIPPGDGPTAVLPTTRRGD